MMDLVSASLRKQLFISLIACAGLVACDDGGGGSSSDGSDAGADGLTAVSDGGGNAQTDTVGVAVSDGGPLTDSGTTVAGPPDAGPVQDSTTGPGPGPTPSGPVDPGCLDGQYSETLPTPNVSLDAVKSGYSVANLNQFILELLSLRYPTGAYIVNQALTSGSSLGDCVAYFAYDTSTADKVIGTLSTVVHECGHFLDIELGGWTTNAYVITEDNTLQCEGGDKFEYGGNTFVRSELMDDDYAELRPLCADGQWGGCDSYADVYLVGDSGNQGFNTLMEEAVQYVNSLATGYAFNDQSTWTVSEKDGIMTFLWYIERYLHLARTKHPETHSFILGNACFRELILTVWGRAWLYLEVTEPIAKLGMEDGLIEELVMAPELLAEIQSVREAHGCQ
jgi:hypothetical protein